MSSSKKTRKLLKAGIVVSFIALFSHGGPAVHAASQPMARCWDVRRSISPTGGLIVDDAGVYAVDEGSKVVGIDKKLGTVIWSAELGGRVAAQIRGINGAIIVATQETGETGAKAGKTVLRSLSRKTGITNWSVNVPHSATYSFSMAQNLVIVGTDSGLLALGASDGSLKWRRDVANFSLIPWVRTEGALALGKDDASIDFVSTADGALRDRVRLVSGTSVLALTSEEMVIVSDGRGTLSSVARGSTEKRWSYKTGGVISHLLLFDDNVVAASTDNFIYSISSGSGDVRWKRRLPGRFASIAKLGSDKIGVTVVGEKTAYVIDSGDGKFLDQFTLAADEEFVGDSLIGDATFLAGITTVGVAAYSTECGTGKSGN